MREVLNQEQAIVYNSPMHAYLIIGRDDTAIESEIDRLKKEYQFKRLNYGLQNIADARELKSITKITTPTPLAIVVKNINEASTEALNSLLKTIEEPADNYYFLFSAPNTQSVLDTIVSRCKIVRTTSTAKHDYKQAKKFIDGSLGKKFEIIEKFKERSDAISFCMLLIYYLHSNLYKPKLSKNKLGKMLNSADRAYQNISLNGNIPLNLGLLSIEIHDIMKDIT